MSVEELKKVLGVLFALTRTTQGRQNLWSSEDFIFPAPRFGARFGIGRNRFDDSLRYLCFCPQSEYENKNDRWSPVRRLIDAHNQHIVQQLFIQAGQFALMSQ